MMRANWRYLPFITAMAWNGTVAVAQPAGKAKPSSQLDPSVAALKSALSSRIGGTWVGVGQLPELGAYRSERQFIRISANEIAVLHKMTVGKMLLSFDSLSFVFGASSVELKGEDMRGQALRAHLVKSNDPLSFMFQRGDDWRSVYSAFRPDAFTLDVFTNRDGSWVSYLQTVHRRSK
jgi:hypothetical protein